jgi:putative ATP-dependent endonuclease of OLD family
VQQLMEHYFSALAPIKHKPRSQRDIVNRPMTLRNPGNLQVLLRNVRDNRALQLAWRAWRPCCSTPGQPGAGGGPDPY